MKIQNFADPLAYSVDDACQRIGIGRTVLYALLKEKKLRAIKIGRRTVIPEIALQEFLKTAPAYDAASD